MKDPGKNFKAASDPARLLPEVLNIGREASALLMGFYQRWGQAGVGRNDAIKVEIKADDSPVTTADIEASQLLVSRLQALTPGIAVVSEENDVDPADTSAFWTVDPLDGTREFIDRTGGFFIKIALMENFRPVLGVVCAPVFETIYYAVENGSSWKQVGEAAPYIIKPRPAFGKGDLATLFNQKHANPDLYQRVRLELAGRGLVLPADPDINPSLPRSLQVAEGLADICVATGLEISGGGGYIWDTAADNLIVRNAGGLMVAIEEREAAGRKGEFEIASKGLLEYETAREKSPGFIVFGDRKLGTSVFPELKNIAS